MLHIPLEGRIQVLSCDIPWRPSVSRSGRQIDAHSHEHNYTSPSRAYHVWAPPCLWLGKMSKTSVKMKKNDTMPKLIDTRSLRGRSESMQQSSATHSLRPSRFCGVGEDCCTPTLQGLLVSSFWHGVIPTSFFIFNDIDSLNKNGH